MPTLQYMAELEKKVNEKQNALFEKVCEIRNSETSEEIRLRKDLRLEWNLDLEVVLEAKLHLDFCYRDGEKLKDVSSSCFESSVIGGMDLGAYFLRYKLDAAQENQHFEQCPKCKIIYTLPPSPKDLERIKKTKPGVYKIGQR